ncbi:MAG TPA: hotdog fold thioesterase [Burkholderiaceae bacterium]|jgi:1,4-dihydroxy-2-naphthoyl-CoA hydrolase|nr:hotdog fold thioesterase [Burkholderiaceae bacterium]
MNDSPASVPASAPPVAATPAPQFRRAITPAELNKMHLDTVVSHMGIEFTDVGINTLSARMPVDRRTVQPAGILHGGSSVTLAETLGSVCAWMCLDEGSNAVGLDINANHIRAVREGWVHGRCRPVHVGRTTHVWQIEIEDEHGRMVCTSRITMAVVPSQKVARPA